MFGLLAQAEDIDKIPGIRLLDFFKGFMAGVGNVQFSTLKPQALSECMEFIPLSEDDAKSWMHHWRKKEFIA
ncbi:hypothetical protein B0H13DRAFT_2379802 [Mycena leptocephala]|nr:hypothetical protein B0H13DRAFT_2379802 [Mycena leptocephala]